MPPTSVRWRKSECARIEGVPHKGNRQAETITKDRDRPCQLTLVSN